MMRFDQIGVYMQTLLNSLEYPEQIQNLTVNELLQLIQECRERIIEVTSQRGGHLASSLGTVEITVALFKLFDFRYDRLVWDVGHQAYTHKLLTGRNATFDTLAQKNGVKKFLSRTENSYDHFGAGHASTSISACLGMAIGRDHKKQKNYAISVIGDGAMTGGLAFEALNYNGYLDRNQIVIFNDNGMSIDPNVGALSKMITRVSASRSYNKLRHEAWELSAKVPFSDSIRTGLQKINASLKSMLTPGMLFESLGWRYFGPVDGHHLEEILSILEHVKDLEGPILVHALTQKGKGYPYAEEDAFKYHGVTPFVPESGEFLKKITTTTNEKSYSKVFGEVLEEVMKEDPNVVAISAAMMSGTGIIGLQEKYPERIFDVGIAEGHAVTMAAGIATTGVKPFVAIYSTFLQRAIDHIIHDVAIQKLPVSFMLDRAGLVGADGPTHQGVYDLTYLRMIPGMVIMAPKNGAELKKMVRFAHRYDAGPSAVRYPRGNTNAMEDTLVSEIVLGKADILADGEDLAIFAIGSAVKSAEIVATLLEQRGYRTAVINARFVKPLDVTIIEKYATSTRLLVTIEESSTIGGFGSGILEVLSSLQIQVSTLVLGVPDRFIEHGNPEQQKEDCELGVTQIFASILERLESKQKEKKRA